VRVTAATPAVAHDGHTYHFCSESCRERFAKDPSKFLPAK
jgi:P-type Cu+ transporter